MLQDAIEEFPVPMPTLSVFLHPAIAGLFPCCLHTGMSLKFLTDGT